MDLWHLGLNMYVLHNFGPLMIETIGVPSFLLMYMAAGITGSCASLLWHTTLKTVQYSSLGASGSIIGVISAFAIYQPNAKFKIVFTPDDLGFDAIKGLMGLVTFDTIGMIMKWKFLDHAAHLGGAFTGFVFWKLYCQLYGTNNDTNNTLSDKVKNMESISKITNDNISDILCVQGKWIYQGNYKNYRSSDSKGIIYAPTKTFCGEMIKDNFIFNGIGCLRNELNGSVFYGKWKDGKSDGIGLLIFNDGTYTPAIYDTILKDFKIPDTFDINDLKYLFKNTNNISIKIMSSDMNIDINNDNNIISHDNTHISTDK